MAGDEKQSGRVVADAFEKAAGALLDQTEAKEAPGRPSIGADTPLTGEETDRVDMAMGLKSIGSNAPLPTNPAPADPAPPKADEGAGNEGTDVVDPAKPSQPPSDQIEAPERPADAEPPSVRFPDNDRPVAPADGADDLGLSPSEQVEPELEEPVGEAPEVGRPFDDLDLMPPEVQDVDFPDPSGEQQFDDPGFELEAPSDFGAENEVPSDSIDGFDGGSVDEGF